MDKRVILAVAGSGKTYTLCSEIDINKRNLIIAYTNQNIKNIYNTLIKKFGFIPDNTLVMTFHSFIYKYLIRPFDRSIGEFYGINNFVSNGVTVITPPASSLLINGVRRKNKYYNKDDTLEHYIKNGKYYSDYLSKLILKTNNRHYSLLNDCCENINKFFDSIYIDEMQDFREHNWKLLCEIIERVNNILLVGDYYQHSVSGVNNFGIPFVNKKHNLSYDEYVKYLCDLNLDVDDQLLVKSRRCSEDVCSFIEKKLNIKIESLKINEGSIVLLTDSKDIQKILADDSIVKLVWDKANEFEFNAISWGYSKGDTYDNTCVILTDVYSNLDGENFVNVQSNISTNKLYVALSRSRGNVYLIKKSQLNEK